MFQQGDLHSLQICWEPQQHGSEGQAWCRAQPGAGPAPGQLQGVQPPASSREGGVGEPEHFGTGLLHPLLPRAPILHEPNVPCPIPPQPRWEMLKWGFRRDREELLQVIKRYLWFGARSDLPTLDFPYPEFFSFMARLKPEQSI